MPARNIIGPQHVDHAVLQAILRVGTAGTFTTLPPDVRQWCERVLQLPYHLGGFGIIPLVQSAARSAPKLSELPDLQKRCDLSDEGGD